MYSNYLLFVSFITLEYGLYVECLYFVTNFDSFERSKTGRTVRISVKKNHWNNNKVILNRCEIPCPRDCQVGPWSEWSPCMPPKCPAEHNNDLQDGKCFNSRFRLNIWTGNKKKNKILKVQKIKLEWLFSG